MKDRIEKLLTRGWHDQAFFVHDRQAVVLTSAGSVV